MFGGEGEDGERERGEGFGFFAGGDDGGADGEIAGEAEGGVEVGADDDGGVDAENAHAVQELFGEFFWRAEKFFGSGDVEDGAEMRVGREEKQVPRLSCASLGMTMCQTFDARGELAGALEQRGAGAGFFCEGARQESDGGEDFKLGAGEAGFDAEGGGTGVQGANPLAGRGSYEDGDGTFAQLWTEAQHGLRGKFADVEAGVEGGHLRAAFSGASGRVADQGVRDCQRMLWSLWGGLRRSKSTTLAKRSRVISTRWLAPVRTVVESGSIWLGWQWRTRPALLLVQACWVSRRTLAWVRSAAAR